MLAFKIHPLEYANVCMNYLLRYLSKIRFQKFEFILVTVTYVFLNSLDKILLIEERLTKSKFIYANKSINTSLCIPLYTYVLDLNRSLVESVRNFY